MSESETNITGDVYTGQYRRLLEQHKTAVAYIDEAITEVPAAQQATALLKAAP